MRLIHAPGCPVCVTAVELIDQAVELSLRPGVVLCSYGDMMRVPGSRGDLFSAKARGGDVLLMYSPLEAVAYAGTHPDTEVVFFAVGFETTAPATALALDMERKNAGNASALLGFTQFLFGGIVSPLTGMGSILVSTGVIIAVCCVVMYMTNRVVTEK